MLCFRIYNNVLSLGIMHTLRYSKIWILQFIFMMFRKSVEFISDLFDYLFASVCPASKMGDCNPTMLEAEDSLAEIHHIYLEKLKQISSMLPAINLAPQIAKVISNQWRKPPEKMHNQLYNQPIVPLGSQFQSSSSSSAAVAAAS